MAIYVGKWNPKRYWTVKAVHDATTASGMEIGDALEFTGTGDGTTNSKLKRVNLSPEIVWGDRCKGDTNDDIDKISLFVGTKEYIITREVVVRLICKPKASGSASWTAEEGGP